MCLTKDNEITNNEYCSYNNEVDEYERNYRNKIWSGAARTLRAFGTQ